MPTISNDEVEVDARALLREQLMRSPWFREGLSDDERQKRIGLEVDAWWHLKVGEAARRLIDRAVYRDAAECLLAQPLDAEPYQTWHRKRVRAGDVR